MRVDVLTIFPDMFERPMSTSIMGIARDREILDFHVHDLRDWTHDRHRTTDDTPYGGGPGMVMKVEPVVEALEAIVAMDAEKPFIVFLTPAGHQFKQARAHELAEHKRLLFVCGRYEGFDQRALSRADLELSIGDYVLTGGELPAMVIIDSITRLLPGVLGDCESSVDESFSEGLLEYPQYTRPADFRGEMVPDVLLSGDHGKIRAWRREQALLKTRAVRPDLLDAAVLTDTERSLVESFSDDGILEGN